jgi:hypothetical protein
MASGYCLNLFAIGATASPPFDEIIVGIKCEGSE